MDHTRGEFVHGHATEWPVLAGALSKSDSGGDPSPHVGDQSQAAEEFAALMPEHVSTGLDAAAERHSGSPTVLARGGEAERVALGQTPGEREAPISRDFGNERQVYSVSEPKDTGSPLVDPQIAKTLKSTSLGAQAQLFIADYPSQEKHTVSDVETTPSSVQSKASLSQSGSIQWARPEAQTAGIETRALTFSAPSDASRSGSAGLSSRQFSNHQDVFRASTDGAENNHKATVSAGPALDTSATLRAIESAPAPPASRYGSGDREVTLPLGDAPVSLRVGTQLETPAARILAQHPLASFQAQPETITARHALGGEDLSAAVLGIERALKANVESATAQLPPNVSGQSELSDALELRSRAPARDLKAMGALASVQSVSEAQVARPSPETKTVELDRSSASDGSSVLSATLKNGQSKIGDVQSLSFDYARASFPKGPGNSVSLSPDPIMPQILSQPDPEPLSLSGVRDRVEGAPSNLVSGAVRTDSNAERPVVFQIRDLVLSTKERVTEVQLSPEELGRVRLTFSSGEASQLLSVHVDRAETLDLIRRNLDLLRAELQNAGYDMAEAELLSDDRDRSERDEPSVWLEENTNPSATTGETGPGGSQTVFRYTLSEGRVDIRI